MRILQSSVFRAICAIIIGALLIKFPDNTVMGITVAIGVLFLISGLISCVTYFWAKRNVSEYKIYDAEGNLVAGEKPTFKEAWKSHRCIIPASYYYEWEHLKSPDGKIKTGDKYAIQPTDCTTTWLCGLYRIEDGYPVFVVLTQEPTEELVKIHDRMPVMLPANRIDEWINPATNPEELLGYTLSEMIIEKAE